MNNVQKLILYRYYIDDPTNSTSTYGDIMFAIRPCVINSREFNHIFALISQCFIKVLYRRCILNRIQYSTECYSTSSVETQAN